MDEPYYEVRVAKDEHGYWGYEVNEHREAGPDGTYWIVSGHNKASLQDAMEDAAKALTYLIRRGDVDVKWVEIQPTNLDQI